MLKAILFDLDGTLLDINMEIFLQHYFAEMMQKAREWGYQEVKKLAEQVYLSTDVMIADRSSTLNEESFMAHFLAAWAHPEQDTRDFFDAFYSQAYPRLHPYCKPLPGVPEMMQCIFDRGFKVVIATNAVFPLTAIKQRLDWGGIGHFPYSLITSYEVMHYCKPHLEFYREICEKIGVQPEECLMVGNDVGEDLPAGQTGMKTYLVEDQLIDKGESNLTPDWRGTLSDLMRFLDHLE